MVTTAINLSSLDGSNGFRLDGAEQRDSSGRSVSNAGDVNGDGFDDVIVSASLRGSYHIGASYVVFGKASGFGDTMNLSSLDGSTGFRLLGDYNTLGATNAGDINGDGFDDVIVRSDPYVGEIVSYVVFGKAAGFSATTDLSSLDGSNGFRLTGGGGGNNSNYSVSSAGDVNGDGFDDLIVGNDGEYYGGFSFVVFGKVSGFGAETPIASLMDGTNGFLLAGSLFGDDAAGASVSGAGDVNGDGFDDLLVGDPIGDISDGSYDFDGSSYVVFGKASGFSATMELASLDGSNGFRLNGEMAGDFSGNSVSNAGDVNGDGFDDVIIGAPRADPNGDQSGSSYVMFGKASGFSAVMDLSSLDGSNGFRLDGEMADDFSGFSISNAGDVNGDGFDDLIIGVARADPNGYQSGSSYVIFGRAAGFSAAINLSSLDSNSGVRLDGVATGDLSGGSVSSAGDINSDGFDDLIIGASGADPNGSYSGSGSSYVIFGRSDFGGGNVIAGTPGNDKLTGTPAADIFEAGAGDDSMIGRGGADVFHGDAGDDNIRVSDLSFGLVDGGSGNDALHLAGSDLNLD
nr:FG-GAP repeat protein [Nitrosomonas sp.]